MDIRVAPGLGTGNEPYWQSLIACACPARGLDRVDRDRSGGPLRHDRGTIGASGLTDATRVTLADSQRLGTLGLAATSC
jgi:hypothetical protein